MLSSTQWWFPFPRNPFFIGHQALLASLFECLTHGPLLLCGIGGIGKSALAVEYSFRSQDRYTALIWLDASSPAAVNAQVGEMRRSCPALFTSLWQGDTTTMLLILDDLNASQPVADLLPTPWNGHLLITTRFGPTHHVVAQQVVPPLSLEEGAQLLLRRGKLISMQGTLPEATALQQQEALTLSGEIGGFPLALEQAGAYLEATRCRPTTYRTAYQKWPAKLLGMRGRVPGPLHPASVAQTVETLIEDLAPAHQEVLRLVAFLPPDGFVCAPSWDREALDVLLHRFLIEACEGTEHVFRMHRVVQTIIRASIAEEQRERYANIAASLSPEGKEAHDDH